MTVPSSVSPPVSWARAIVLAVVMSIALTLLLMVIPHLILTALPLGSRGVRVVLATAWIASATLGIMAIGYRWLTPSALRPSPEPRRDDGVGAASRAASPEVERKGGGD
jgi:hypothetical protein